MLIALNSDPTDVDAGRRKVPVPQRILSFNYTTGLLGNYPRERVARLVDMNLPDPRPARVALQVFREGVRRERRAGSSRPVMPRPERAVTSESVHPVT